MRTIQLNAALGSMIVTIGLWLLWGDAPIPLLLAVVAVTTGLLVWKCASIPEVWAWTTLLLGLESFAYPVLTMVQIRMATTEPSNEQMGLMLTAIVFGVFSSIFWLTFSYGIFKRLTRRVEGKVT